MAGVRGTFLLLVALSVVTAQAESVALVLLALIADSVARGAEMTQVELGPLDLGLGVSAATIVTAIAIVVASLVIFTYARLWARTFARLERHSRDEIVSSFAGADWTYQATQKSSELQGRLLRLMDARATAFSGLIGWARALTTIAVFITVATVMSPLGAVVIVAFAAVLSVVVLPMRLRTVRIARKAAGEEVSLAGDVAEAVDHGADVQVFGAWPAFTMRFSSRSRSLQQLRARLGTIRYLIPMVYQYGAFALILLILLVASVVGSSSGFGQFAASALLLLRSVQYGQQLQSSLQTIAESLPRVELLRREMDRIPPPEMTAGERVLGAIEHVELRDVSYQYPSTAGLALSGVSLTLRPGIIVGVAGPSGSGKSTLAQILLRLRVPESGQYLVNGRPAAEYSAASWRSVVSHVPQQPHLLHGTLAENVSFFDESISRDTVAASLTAVGLQDLVESLPGGLDAELGPTGRNLSGGQVQRLGIARALARAPRLVVLDEPTSALDANAERVVGDALEALRGRSDVLVVVIAHRPTTLALCDEMVVLQDGRVTATGSSREVAQDNQFLAAAWGSE
jgi:ABC-type multidrug transport system fused ATPase/permease subunit